MFGVKFFQRRCELRELLSGACGCDVDVTSEVGRSAQLASESTDDDVKDFVTLEYFKDFVGPIGN